MRTCLLAMPVSQVLWHVDAGATPPRDRTSRTDRDLAACREAWARAFELAQSKGLSQPKALRMASVAYKLAMPNLNTMPAIRATISCIAQGITLEVFDGRDASQLLYAAQVALTLLKQKGGKS